MIGETPAATRESSARGPGMFAPHLDPEIAVDGDKIESKNFRHTARAAGFHQPGNDEQPLGTED